MLFLISSNITRLQPNYRCTVTTLRIVQNNCYNCVTKKGRLGDTRISIERDGLLLCENYFFDSLEGFAFSSNVAKEGYAIQ